MDKQEALQLEPFATEREKHYLEKVMQSSLRLAAKELGVHERSVTRALQRLRKRAAQQGYAPEHDMVHTCPEGYRVKGVSTLYTHGEEGSRVAAQWVKTDAVLENQKEALREFAEGLSEEIKRAKPTKPPKHTLDDLLNCFVISDYHLGMKAWGEETGANWDAQIAEELLYKWFDTALVTAPKSKHALLIQLGDWLHFDGLEAVTPQSGHLLDADTRFQKLIRITIRVWKAIVQRILETHETLHIIMAEGNHDLSASAWMREMFASYYENEPRVTVDVSPDPYYCFEFGACSIFSHHGHKRNTKNIQEVFAGKFREIFGRTKYSYAHLGHLHSEKVIESQTMIVEQHRTLASSDAYASRGGWNSGRSAKVITYHRDFGKIGEVQISPEMI